MDVRLIDLDLIDFDEVAQILGGRVSLRNLLHGSKRGTFPPFARPSGPRGAPMWPRAAVVRHARAMCAPIVAHLESLLSEKTELGHLA